MAQGRGESHGAGNTETNGVERLGQKSQGQFHIGQGLHQAGLQRQEDRPALRGVRSILPMVATFAPPGTEVFNCLEVNRNRGGRQPTRAADHPTEATGETEVFTSHKKRPRTP